MEEDGRNREGSEDGMIYHSNSGRITEINFIVKFALQIIMMAVTLITNDNSFLEIKCAI